MAQARIRPALPFILAALSSAVCCAQSPDRFSELLVSGMKLSEQERYAEAAEAFRQCVALDPRSFEARYDLALALFAIRRLSEAREAIGQVGSGDATVEAARLYLLGKIDEAAGDKARARRELEAAFNSDPAEENHALDYGMFLIRSGDHPAAIAALSRTAEVHPQSEFVLLGLAIAQAFGGKPEDAVATSRRIIQVDPRNTRALLIMAFAQYLSGQYADAERTSAHSLELPSPAPYLYYLHAASLLKINSKSFSRMLEDLDAAERGIPSCTLCYLVRSKVHETAGDLPAAIADLNLLTTRIAPDYDQAWYRLATLYRRQGLATEAEAARARFETIRASRADAEMELARQLLLGGEQK
jgi:tetratricopeptide (TPR) repeat protein